MLLLIVSLITFVQCEETFWEPATQDTENGYLKHVHIFFRHGHRVPLTKFPTDPNANSTLWDDEAGQLTILGKQQGFLLGQNLKSRYGNFLPEERVSNYVNVESSDTIRTLMTAEMVLAGLLPPKGIDRWGDLNWQPIPIHKVTKEVDNYNKFGERCPRFLNIMNNLPENITDEDWKKYNYITEMSGLKIETMEEMADLYSCLEIELQAGLRLPHWTDLMLEFMRKETAKYLLRTTKTKDLIRIRVGSLFKKLLKDVTEKPFNLYSTHDRILSDILGGLGLRNLNPPNFVSVIIIEFREDTRGHEHVQLWWREGPYDGLSQLTWNGCEEKCPIEKLRLILTPFISNNWNQECVSPVTTTSAPTNVESSTQLQDIILAVCFLVSLMIVIIYFTYTKCNCEAMRYELLF